LLWLLLGCRARQRGPVAAAADAGAAAQPALTFDQLKAHLERHTLGHKQQQQDPIAEQAAAHAAAADAADDESGQPAAAEADAVAGTDLDIADVDDGDDGFDELVVEPPQQQQAGDASWLLPETQQMLEELPGAVAAAGTGAAALAGTEAPADELDLQLDDAADDEQDNEAADGSGSEGDDEEMGDAAGSGDESEDEEAVGSGSDEEELYDSSEIEDEQQESQPEAEPLHWEEEEGEIGGSGSQQQGGGEGGVAAAGGGEGAAAAAAAKKVKKTRRAAGGFIEAEADLSDEEGRGGSDDESDDEDDDDPELVSGGLVCNVYGLCYAACVVLEGIYAAAPCSCDRQTSPTEYVCLELSQPNCSQRKCGNPNRNQMTPYCLCCCRRWQQCYLPKK
jgi:hypothetical protein